MLMQGLTVSPGARRLEPKVLKESVYEGKEESQQAPHNLGVNGHCGQ
jgi:hypothetical protein